MIGDGDASLTLPAESVRFLDASPAPTSGGATVESYLEVTHVIGGQPVPDIDVTLPALR
ncbi:hypothetical protein ACIBU0_44125 [Streptomyces sp. NPDC049627]|uniref:hypothetical protein n=1 Tax=Streptomyces sp. NPDC049627 TaxID=3365595 RepID=UPI0037A12D9A